MIEFLNALKADLLDRRLLPVLALVVVALIAAVGYVALGGGSNAAAPVVSSPSVVAQSSPGHLTVSALTPERAPDEVPTGKATQHGGSVHNPFESLVKASTTTTSSSKSASSASSSSGSSPSSSGSSGSGGSTPEPETTKEPETITPTKKTKKQIVYHVAALFGLLPQGEVATTVQLTPFVNIPLLTPLPSAQEPLIVFRGVTTGGKSATFTVVGEVILRGSAGCLPSAQQCEAIDLQPGKSEQLEYVPATGPAQVYELKIVSISSGKASASSVKSLLDSESKAGREVLRHNGLVAIPYLHPSAQYGVLAFAARKPFSRRAYGARRR